MEGLTICVQIVCFGCMNSSGGVVLASQDGKIVCDNTLDARVDVSFRQKLPEVYKRSIYVHMRDG